MKRHLNILLLALLITYAAGVRAQNPTPTPFDKQTVAPEDLKGIPSIAPDFQSNVRDLPDLGRVGVDMTQQRPVTLREIIELALENNRDIEVSRKNIDVAKFDLLATRGFFQPRLFGQAYYDRTITPNVSIFSSNQKFDQNTILGTATVQSFVPKYGTTMNTFINNQRVYNDNSIGVLSPQLNASIGFNLTQPLFRGRKIDQSRRTIARSQSETSHSAIRSFWRRSIDVVTNAEKAYWDLAFALRNLQVQRDGVGDARSQLEHNRRLVEEGQLAPIDVVAAETQVANFEQAVYDALNIVNQAENALKNLVSPVRTDAALEPGSDTGRPGRYRSAPNAFG